MELLRFECPSCGAELPPKLPTGELRCEYCGSRFAPEGARRARTEAGAELDQRALIEVARRAYEELAATQRQLAEAQARQAEAEVEARRAEVEAREREGERKRKRWLLAGLGGALRSLVAFVVIVVVVAVTLAATGVLDLASWLLSEDTRERLFDRFDAEGVDPWAGPPIVVEIAGQPAVITRIRDHDDAHIHVDAHAIQTGERLWRIGPLNRDDSEVQEVRFTVAGPWVVVSDANEQVFVHELETGARIRSAKAGAPVAYLCTIATGEAGEVPQVYVRTTKRRHSTLDPETGELERTRAVPFGCELELANTLDRSELPAKKLRAKLDDHELGRALADPSTGRAAVFGVRELDEGRREPVILGVHFEPEADRDKHPKLTVREAAWTAPFAEAVAPWPIAATLAGGRVFVGWTDGEGNHLAALGLETGERRFDRTIEAAIGDRLVALAATPDYLLVSRAHVLEIRDAATGELIRSLGEAP